MIKFNSEEVRTLDEWQKELADWAKSTFGDTQVAVGVVNHLEEEYYELLEAIETQDKELITGEMADVWMLINQACSTMGLNFGQCLDRTFANGKGLPLRQMQRKLLDLYRDIFDMAVNANKLDERSLDCGRLERIIHIRAKKLFKGYSDWALTINPTISQREFEGHIGHMILVLLAYCCASGIDLQDALAAKHTINLNRNWGAVDDRGVIRRGLTSSPFAPGAVSRREECVLNGLIE